MRYSTRLLVLLLMTTCFAAVAFGAERAATVSRSTYVRASSSSKSAIRAQVFAADEVTVLSAAPRNGYLRVRTAAGVAGWVYARNIRIHPEEPVQVATPQPLPAHGATRAQTLAQSASTVQRHTCTSAITDAMTCHQTFAEGCTNSTKPSYDPFLNFLKNQTVPPDSADQQVVGTLTSLADFQKFDAAAAALDLSHGQAQAADALAAIGQGNIYQVVGYLYYAIPGGKGETCNCKLTSVKDGDFHIGIGFDPIVAGKILNGTLQASGNDPDPLKQTSVVVEMTPHYRVLFHNNWTLPRVMAQAGHQVKLIGQLVVDTEHDDAKQNCASSDADQTSCWRGSAWQIHPVTRMWICTTAAPCDAASAGWKELDALP